MKFIFFLPSFLFIFSFSIHAQSPSPDSLKIKIGQMILIGYPGPSVDEKVLTEIKSGKVGSIILFEKNVPKTNSYIALKRMTWAYQQAAPIPLFICIDQEGGLVNRLKDKYGFPKSITATQMGKAGSLDTVRLYGEATASTLAGLGLNVNFAPCVDLASNPSNFIARAGRPFSSNEDSVALLAKEFILQHRKYNVVTSLKHFPGHGSANSDTHFGLADVTQTWEDKELVPYKNLIDQGLVDAVMTAHIVNKNLDPQGNPGTLSKPILTDLLRNKLGFNGVVFSDDMQMHAISKNYSLEKTVKLAIQAGVDIMCFSNNISGSDERTVDVIHKIINSLIEKGEISEERIDQSFKRIMSLKRQRGLMPIEKIEPRPEKPNLPKSQEEVNLPVSSPEKTIEKPETPKKKRRKK